MSYPCPACYEIATTLFSDTHVQITSAGRSYLGAAIGSNAYVQEFVRDKVVGWSAEITRLAKFTQVQPHAAYSALTHGLSSHWLYLCRTTPNISEVLQPLEDNIRLVLIPTLTGCSPPNDAIRKLFALPPRYGGLGIINPTNKLEYVFTSSNQQRNFYFNRLPQTFNSLPVIDLTQPFVTIKFQPTKILWQHFIRNFDPDNQHSFHFTCPCSICSKHPKPPNFDTFSS